jgi:hypothetical protein
LDIAVEDAIAILILFLIAGGGIIVLDALIIRRLRQGAGSRRDDS